MEIESANPLRNLFDAAVRHYGIKLTCAKCHHVRIFDPHALWYLFDKRRWRDDLQSVRKRCVCTRCGARGPKLELVYEEATGELLSMPQLHQWKRELRRRR